MRILGLDIGERRIGVALSDALGLTAQRLTVIERRTASAALETICRVVDEHRVERIIVGWPLMLSGTRGVQAQRVEAFAKHLQQRVPVPVELLDERLTTVQGERALLETGASRRKRKQVIDQVAAQLLLQHYLDGQRRTK